MKLLRVLLVLALAVPAFATDYTYPTLTNKIGPKVSLATAAAADGTVGTVTLKGSVPNHVIYLVWNDNCVDGQILIECADSATQTEDWSILYTANYSAGDTVTISLVALPVQALRVRLNGALSGTGAVAVSYQGFGY